MSTQPMYLRNWDNFWRETVRKEGAILWDCEPEGAIAYDYERFRSHMDPSLPMIDLGCGHGRQTRFLAEHYEQSFGLDISGEAIRLARRTNSMPRLEYRQFDATRSGEAQEFHQQNGDCNLYMRGVLHQIRKEDRQVLLESIATLLGNRGCAYFIEPRSRAERIFAPILKFGGPESLRRVFKNGIEPIGLSDDELAALIPRGYQLRLAGVSPLQHLKLAGFISLPIPGTVAFMNKAS